MRYLNTRDVFVQNLKINIQDAKKINEVLTNEITFGGSLLGRFINSTIRKAKIGYNYYRVESIVKAIEAELNNIIFDGLPDEEKKQIKILLVSYYLKAIKDVCEDTNIKESEKIKQLIGNAERSLIPSCRKWIETLEETDEVAGKTKQQLLDSLENFEEGINSLKKVSDNANKLAEDTKNFIEDTIKLYDLFTTVSATSSATASAVNTPTISLNLSSLDFGKILIGTSSTSQKIELTGSNIVLTQPIDFDFTSQDFLLSFDNKTFNTTESLTLSKSNFKKDIWIKFRPKGSKGNIKERLKIFGGGLTSPVFTDLIGYRDIPKRNLTPVSGPLKPNKKYFVEINGKKRGPIYFVSSDTSNQINKFRNTKGEIIERSFGTPLFENYDFIDNLFENYVLNSFLFEELSVDPAEVDKANKFNESTIKQIDRKSLFDYLRMNKKNKNDEQFIKFANRIKDPNYNLSVAPINLSKEIKGVLTIMEQLINSLNKHDDYFWESEDIKNGDVLKEWIDSANKIKNSENTNYSSTCEDEFKKDKCFGQNFIPVSNETEKEKNKLEEKIDNSKATINFVDEAGQNRLLKIVDLFGKAYSCFATDLIPSGRPGGRISTKTRNEYFYIGSGATPEIREESGPGFGPWANRLIFQKFGEQITKLISFDKYKKILSASTIKTTTDEIVKGNVLLEFMRDMIDQNNLKNFDEKRSAFLTKYFGLTKKLTKSSPDARQIDDTEENEDGLMWVGETFTPNNLKEGQFVLFCFEPAKDKNTFIESARKIVGLVLKVEDKKALIKFQIGSIALIRAYSDYGKGSGLPNSVAKDNNLSNESRKRTFLGAFKLDLQDGQKYNLTTSSLDAPSVAETFSIKIVGPSGKGGRRLPPSILKNKEGYIEVEDVRKINDRIITNDKQIDINSVFKSLTESPGFGEEATNGNLKPAPDYIAKKD